MMFSELEWDWLDEYSKRPWLGDHWAGSGNLLWIHPGSGSEEKTHRFPVLQDSPENGLILRA